MTTKLKIWSGLIGVAFVALCCGYVTQLGFPTREAASVTVRLAAEKVLLSQLTSPVLGNYWENEMTKQANALRDASLNERLSYYLIILLNCELDTSRATLFAEMVQKDAQHFEAYLREFAASKRFQHLTEEKKVRLKGWIQSLQLIAASGESV